MRARTKSDDGEANVSLRDSLEELFASLESALLVYAQKLLHNEETAQDIVQEAFIKLHVHADTVRQPRVWLYRTVHNLAMNHLRSTRKMVALDSGQPGNQETTDSQPLPDEYIERMEAIGQVRLCLDTLDGRSRELLRLKFEEELSYQQMSERTQLSIGHVGYLLHHALKDLTAELKKAGVVQ